MTLGRTETLLWALALAAACADILTTVYGSGTMDTRGRLQLGVDLQRMTWVEQIIFQLVGIGYVVSVAYLARLNIQYAAGAWP